MTDSLTTAPGSEPQTLEEAVKFLRGHGVEAERHDWALGRTVVVPGGEVEETAGIRLWPRVIWIVEDDELSSWFLFDARPYIGVVARCGSLRHACVLALQVVGDAWEVVGRSAVAATVQRVLRSRGRAYLLIDLIADQPELVVDVGSAIGGCPIEAWLEQPRDLDEEGKPRKNRFAMVLVDGSDARKFQPGQVHSILTGAVRSSFQREADERVR